ncbi:MAG: hypothetical protein FJX72_09830 [Armatimonadetes bacterium]|nr:hypothetical protein [Armatimonadota bacterium]
MRAGPAACAGRLGQRRGFCDWYNNEHHHAGLANLTPAVVHRGLDRQVIARRQSMLNAAYRRYPKRFVDGRPRTHRSMWPSGSTRQPPPRDTTAKGEHILT